MLDRQLVTLFVVSFRLGWCIRPDEHSNLFVDKMLNNTVFAGRGNIQLMLHDYNWHTETDIINQLFIENYTKFIEIECRLSWLARAVIKEIYEITDFPVVP